VTAAYHHALPSGTRIASYEVRGVLGVGGFGITYKAYDHDLARDVAVKEYLPTTLAVRGGDRTTVTPKSEGDSKDFRYGLQRFLEEARTLARFREPHIVRIITYLESHGTAYFVMDYEEGESLAERLKTAVTLTEASILAIAVPILRGLAVIHSQQFLHRDVKPQNIYLRRDDSPVLLDFGAARQALGAHSRAMTGLVTPGYAPFEQYLSGDKQGPWSDIYGVGATMYHCVTGYAPVAATDRVAAIRDGETDPVLKVVGLLRQRYSSTFLDVMIWMLAPEAKDRPQSADEALQALPEAPSKTRQRPRQIGGLGDGHRDSETVELDALAQPADRPPVQPETLKAVELSLEQHIGPISRAFVRKAASRTHSVEEMTQLLSRFIPSELGKTEFIARTRALSAETIGAREPGAVRGDSRETAPPTSTSAPSAAAGLNMDIVQAAERKLATYVGPVAKVLVRKARAQAKDVDAFHRLLAQELSSEEARSAFLKDVGTT
jgi:serine/threonine protein kinase